MLTTTPTTRTLGQRLRHETTDAHRAAEAATGLPGTVTSSADYGLLLGRLASFHRSVEEHWADSRWAGEWAAVGIDLADHTRSHLLEADLRTLAFPSSGANLDAFGGTGWFGSALGSLYVVEGSALGGMFLSPLIRRTLGDVPTRFYDSDGRHHPRPWRSLQRALTVFSERGGDQDDVVQGARDAFGMFSTHLASELWSTAR
jgi:heme oxygenase